MTMNPGGLGIADMAELQEVRRDERGVLYTARDLKLDRPVAVRVFRALPNAVDRERFGHEAQLLGRLSAHPNVVTIYDTGFTEGHEPFLITELVNGADLGRHSQNTGPLPWARAVDITLQICAGLEQAHRSGALHRDLRPETVLMSGATPKITDFAMSVFSRPGFPVAGGAAHAAAREPGPELHRAPETFQEVWDERTDLYSAASVLYHLIDGQPPMWRPSPDSMEAFRLRLAHQGSPALADDRAPAALNVFILAALSKDPLDRPQTAAEFAKELRLIRDGRTTGATPSVLHNTGAVTSVASPTTSQADRTVVSALARPGPVTHAVDPAVTTAPSPAVAAGISAAAATASAPTAAIGGVANAFNPGPGSGLEAESSQGHGVQTVVVPRAPEGYQPAPPQPGLGSSGPDNWAPPANWAPPSDGTAVFTDLAEPHDPMAPVPPGEMPEMPRLAEPEPVRSPLFLAAVGLLVLSLVGFLIVIGMSVFGSDQNEGAAPALPDPEAPIEVQANGTEDLTGTTAATDGEAMAEEMTSTTVAEEDAAPTTETTISRLQVPNLVGLNVESATKQLNDLGFEVVVIGRQTANAQPGTVTSQKPDAGSLVTLPLSVTLYIPKASNLPPMVGRPADAVCLELQALGLICNRVNQNHDQVPAGSVIATNPVEGALFSEGSSVALTVSTGPVTNITIPDVAGQSRAEAETTLRNAGFTTIAFAMRPNGAPQDQVFASSPAAGEILASNRPIIILISSGTTAPTVPELVGRTQEEAIQLLEGFGLRVQVTTTDLPADDPAIGMVTASDPQAGTEVEPGSTVTITVGQEAASTTTTTEAGSETTTETTMPDTTVAETTTTTAPGGSETTETTAAP